ncbi:MAG: hypothetical protein N2449_02055 [Bacteroidales bacterium]|nr:hypothetical protein [Bacteroidales bacterium]
MKKYMAVFALVAFLKASAQVSPESVPDSFFFYFKNKGVEQSIQYIFRTNKYLGQNPEVVNTLKAKFDKALPIIGTFYRYEKYLDKRVGNTFAHIGYLMIFDRQPIKIIFTLYKPKDHWQVQDLRFDDKMDDVIKDLENNVK